MGVSSARHSPGIQETFLELVNYVGGVLGNENGQESRNSLFLAFPITKVPKNHEIWRGDLNLIKVPNERAQE